VHLLRNWWFLVCSSDKRLCRRAFGSPSYTGE
jgi:hypothetical protein